MQESPAAKVKCYGIGVQPSAIDNGQRAVFTVGTSQATVKDAPVTVTTTNIDPGISLLSFMSAVNMHKYYAVSKPKL